MSSISIIGTGNMASTIGALAVAGGNTVEVIGRDQSKAADLAKDLGGSTTTLRISTPPCAPHAAWARVDHEHAAVAKVAPGATLTKLRRVAGACQSCLHNACSGPRSNTRTCTPSALRNVIRVIAGALG